MTNLHELGQAAKRLAAVLQRHHTQVVFAESCTGGLVAAMLTRVPGGSSWLCGSAVVYQLETKHRWLGIPQDLLDDPGPVSREVAAAMATGVLERTPQADFAVSVTGHLGPDAPSEQDGLIFIAAASRRPACKTPKTVITRHTLSGEDGKRATQVRLRRQRQAALLVLEAAADAVGGGR